MSGEDRAGIAGHGKETGRGAGSRAGGRPRDPAIEEAIIRATRKRLVADGYSQMTIGDIVADAGVTRPTLYRRWANKYDLVVDALAYGFRAQREAYPDVDMDTLPAVEAFREAVRRLDPRYHNRGAMALHGNFMAEVERAPGLLEQLREHGVRPRCGELTQILLRLRDRGEVREDVDVDTVVTLCFGSYFADYLRTGGSGADVADRVVGILWPAIAAHPGDAG
ncbi:MULTISPECIES: TetR/AcrR family transcriptional regulator [unclassified Streptomyces]|uniref:TetR/AcrR family transcriptional regulator n=1 Tax=unclassified Streptomyces TaxID=2593676 RepID=UPI000371E2CE|nr:MULTISPECIES: TetR/AcrR family transcriptional regulator [unclassified Streptomyces]MYX33167.1 TetR family transcriptional regulator [Streptomyces sp. SID8377]